MDGTSLLKVYKMRSLIPKSWRRKIRSIASKQETVVVVALILGAALLLANFVAFIFALSDRLPGGGHDWK